MLTNYHTHTNRCHHANGTDEEYVKAAVEAGYSILGFSDHAPYYYEDGYESYYKMLPSQAHEYADSLRRLARLYSDKIEIHLGFEAEYYPSIFEKSLKLWREVGIEYLVLGQHFTRDEATKDAHAFAPAGDETLKCYTDVCIAAIETEKFSYFAHPDLLNYTGDNDALYEHETARLVECANRYGVPLEINLLGLYEGRTYPNRRFWEIAAPLKPSVIIGADAHTPRALLNMNCRAAAKKLAEQYGLKLIDKIDFRPL